MFDNDHTMQIPSNDHDATLLEGLFQLTVAGDTQGWEYKKIDSEVYSRLLQTYTG